MTADGFLRTGDIGSLDGQCFLHLPDRKKDMILVSGFNIYPNEVEALLAAHPQIQEACVVGATDAHSGEVVAASIVRGDPSLAEEAVIAYCREGLAAHKCPKRIEFSDELPKSPRSARSCGAPCGSAGGRECAHGVRASYRPIGFDG